MTLEEFGELFGALGMGGPPGWEGARDFDIAELGQLRARLAAAEELAAKYKPFYDDYYR